MVYSTITPTTQQAPELQCLAVGDVNEEEEEENENEKKSVWRPTVPPLETVGKKNRHHHKMDI